MMASLMLHLLSQQPNHRKQVLPEELLLKEQFTVTKEQVGCHASVAQNIKHEIYLVQSHNLNPKRGLCQTLYRKKLCQTSGIHSIKQLHPITITHISEFWGTTKTLFVITT